MKTKKEIEKQLDDVSRSNDDSYSYIYAYSNALIWVLELE